mmetsp:Transcript_56945/g.180167  ORF Transcript_56945/g.180167 Transcript_56945/m.180167 type:complete len:488 (-) Transcript_56945:191-1654(-)
MGKGGDDMGKAEKAAAVEKNDELKYWADKIAKDKDDPSPKSPAEWAARVAEEGAAGAKTSSPLGRALMAKDRLNAVLHCQVLAGRKPTKPLTDQSFHHVISTADPAVAGCESLAAVPRGAVVGFFSGQRLVHLMLCLGGGRAAGKDNSQNVGVGENGFIGFETLDLTGFWADTNSARTSGPGGELKLHYRELTSAVGAGDEAAAGASSSAPARSETFKYGIWSPGWNQYFRAATDAMQMNNFNKMMNKFSPTEGRPCPACFVFDSVENEKLDGWLKAVKAGGTLFILAYGSCYRERLETPLPVGAEDDIVHHVYSYSPEDLAKELDEEGLRHDVGEIVLLRALLAPEVSGQETDARTLQADSGDFEGGGEGEQGLPRRVSMIPIAAALKDALRLRDYPHVTVTEYEAPVDLRFLGGVISLNLEHCTERGWELLAKICDPPAGSTTLASVPVAEKAAWTKAGGFMDNSEAFTNRCAPLSWNPDLEVKF